MATSLVSASIAALILIGVALPMRASTIFTQESISVPIPAGRLSGTLMLPHGSGPFPVALIIAGSGPLDRNGNGGSVQTDAYVKLARALASRGVATLRYDKRGIGASEVFQSESQMRFDNFVNDALALTALLEHDKRFSSVSIIGHSEGSLIGTVVAEHDPHVRALVSLEGPGRNLATIIDEQVRTNLKTPPSIVAEVERINAALLVGKTVAHVDPRLDALFRPSVQPYLISEYKVDPAVEMSKLHIPVLIVHGTSDLQISLADAEALAAADPRATLVVIPGMNHILVDAPLNRVQNFATYSNPSLPLSAKLASNVATFLKAPYIQH